MRKTAMIILFVFCASLAYASWECEWEDKPAEDRYSQENLNAALAGETSSGKIAGLSLIRLYQVFLSGKTGGECVFYPSCSRYGFFAIKKYGAIKGAIMSTDRLFRCHAWSHEYGYQFDSDRSLLLDPVEANDTFNFLFDWLNF